MIRIDFINPGSAHRLRRTIVSKLWKTLNVIAMITMVANMSMVGVFIQPKVAHAATALTTTILSWDTIGLDSNSPVSVLPKKFLVQARITNSGTEIASNVQTNFTWGTGTADAYLSLVSDPVQPLNNINPGEHKDIFYVLNISPAATPDTPSNPTFNTTRPFTITTTSPDAPVSSAGQTLLIEHLNSQSRNHVISNVVTPTNPLVGQTFNVHVVYETASVYTHITPQMTYNPTGLQLEAVTTNYVTDGFIDSDIYAQNQGNVIESNFTFRALAPGNQDLLYTVLDQSGSSFHYNIDENSAITVPVIPRPALEKSVDKAIAKPGDPLTYTLNYANTGNVDLTNVVITETYDSHFTFGSAVPAPSTGNNVWNLGTLPVGATGTITITGTLIQTFTSYTTVHNVARMDSDQTDSIEATADTVVPMGLLKVRKQLDATGNGTYVEDNDLANQLGFRWGLNDETPSREMYTYLRLPFDTYTVTENDGAIPGYHFTGWYIQNSSGYPHIPGTSCTNPTGTILPATVTPADFETIDGYFVQVVLCNAVNGGSLTVNKQFDDNGDGTVDRTNPAGWTWDITGGAQDLAGGSTQPITAGTYTINEDAISGYTSTWSCDIATAGNGTSFDVTVAAGADVTCTFRNTRDTGSIVVEKQTLPDGSTDTFGFSGALTDSITDDQQLTAVVPTGNYTVTEAIVNGWTLTDVVCNDANSYGSAGTRTATFNVEKNETVKCTFTNSRDTGTIIVHKDVLNPDGDPVDDTHAFNVTLNGANQQTIAEGTDATYSNLPTGTYTIVELPDTNYDFHDYSLDTDGDTPGAQVEVTVGQTTEVTVFNKQKKATLTVLKDVLDAHGNQVNDDQLFTINSNDLNFTIQNETISESSPFNAPINPGTYEIEEEDYGTLALLGYEALNPIQSVTVTSNGSATITFINKQLPSSISGMKFNDLNGNGAYDAGEPGLAGWTIYLDLNENGAHDAGEPSVVTDANGVYTFNGLVSGTYDIREANQNGWTQTYPAGLFYDEVSLGIDSEITAKDFGNFENINITVCKYVDLNGDGDITSDPAYTNGWEMTLATVGAANLNQTTGTDGCTVFSDLGPGTYSVTEDESNTNWYQTYPLAGSYNVTAVSGRDQTLNYGNFEKGIIKGVKKDVNGNLLPGWWICLDGMINCVQTDSNGAYQFSGLVAGSHTVKEVLKYGWFAFTPDIDAGHTFNVESGQTYIADFVNGENWFNVSITKTDSPDPVAAGGLLTYTLDWSVTGNTTIHDVTITDTLPINTNFVSADNGGFNNAGIVTWQLGDKQPGANGTVHFTVTVASPLTNGTIINNTAMVCGSGELPNPLAQMTTKCDEDDETTTVNSDYTVNLTKSGPASVLVNGNVTYTLEWSISGNAPVSSLVISDPLPGYTTYSSSAPTGSYDNGTRTVTWDLGPKNPGDSGSLQVTVIANAHSEVSCGSWDLNNTGYYVADGTDGASNTVTTTVYDTCLTVIKHVVNDNGGTAVASNFTMEVTGTAANTSFAGVEAPGLTLHVQPGTYNVNESTLTTGYAKTLGADCSGTINAGDHKTCTVTNDDIGPKLTVTKIVVNNSGGTKTVNDFPLYVNSTNVVSGVQNAFNVGSYVVSEINTHPYDATISGHCDASGNVTLALGDVKECTITNDDQPAYIKLVKTVVNNNGSTLGVADFPLFLNDGLHDISVTSGAPALVMPGNYTAWETNQTGYQASAWSGDCDTTGHVTAVNGETKTCYITNDDIQPKLTVIKHVINDNGGTLTADAVTLNVTGQSPTPSSFNGSETGTLVNLNAGAYTVTEPNVPTGYTVNYSGDCTGSIAVGEHKTCTVTNTDMPAHLILKKYVTNDNGGNATANEWALAATGPVTLIGNGYAEDDVPAGTYTLSEQGPNGYTASAWVCEGGTLNGDELKLALDESAYCEITNDDIAPTVTVIKEVHNNYGGTAGENDFGLTIGGTPVTSGQTLSVNANAPHALNETLLTGYRFMEITGDEQCPSVLGGTVTLNEGENITCTIINEDIQPKLTVTKVVINDNGATKTVADFPLFVDQTQVTSGEQNGFNAGSYVVSETTSPEYVATITGDCDTDGNVTLNIGDVKECTITNNDIPQDGFEVVIEKSGPATANAGDEITYTLNWSVVSTMTVDPVVITDVLDNRLAFVSASPGSNYDATTRTVSWDLGSQAPGANDTVTLTVKTPSPVANGTTIDNTATACGTAAVPYPFSEPLTTLCDDDDTTVKLDSKPELGIEKTATPDIVGPLEQITYTITWSVAGNSQATDVLITDPLPAKTTYVSADCGTTTGTCDISTDGDPVSTAYWNLGTRQPGEGGTVTFVVTTTADVPHHSIIPNEASIRSAEIDPIYAQADVETIGDPVLEIVKTVNTQEANPGDILTYSVTISNTGSATAINVQLTDALPSHFTFTEFGGGIHTWSLGDLLVGQSATVEYDVTVAPNTPAGTYDNLAVATADNHPSVSDTETVNVSLPKLTITKSTDKTFINPGNTVTYTLVVTNEGHATAINVQLEDILPAGFSFQDNSITKSWDLGDLKFGESKTITYTAKTVATLLAGDYENIATTWADNHGKVTANEIVEVRIVKVLGEELPVTGGSLLYWLYALGALVALTIAGWTLRLTTNKEQ